MLWKILLYGYCRNIGGTMKNDEQVNIRLGEKTLRNLKFIQKKMELGSRAQAITISAKVAKVIVDAEKKGAKLYVEREGQEPERLIFI
jgi:hypothetical protein